MKLADLAIMPLPRTIIKRRVHTIMRLLLNRKGGERKQREREIESGRREGRGRGQSNC